MQIARLVGHHRDPAAANRDDHGAGGEQPPDGRQLDDPQRLRRGNHPAPAAVGILDDVPAFCPAPVSLPGVHEGADRLARLRERRVVRGHLGLADQRDCVPVDAVTPELVVEILLQLIADGALGVRPADIQRHLVQLVGGKLGPPQDEADLGTVAVGDRDAPAIPDHVDDVVAGLPRGNVLVTDRLVVLVLDQGIAADRDDSSPPIHQVRLPVSSSSAP